MDVSIYSNDIKYVLYVGLSSTFIYYIYIDIINRFIYKMIYITHPYI